MKKVTEEVPQPAITQFILKNGKGVMGADGIYFHISEVVKLVKSYNDGSTIVESKQTLLDTIINLMAIVDTPIGKLHNKGEFADEARVLAKRIIDANVVQNIDIR